MASFIDTAKASLNKASQSFEIDPKPGDLPMSRHFGRTRVCGNILGRLVGRSERLIKLGNSWFSAKTI